MFNKLRPANDTTAWWLSVLYDVSEIGVISFKKIVEPGEYFYYEPCLSEEAELWMITSTSEGSEQIYIGEYQTREEAALHADLVLSMFPHLTLSGSGECF